MADSEDVSQLDAEEVLGEVEAPAVADGEAVSDRGGAHSNAEVQEVQEPPAGVLQLSVQGAEGMVHIPTVSWAQLARTPPPEGLVRSTFDCAISANSVCAFRARWEDAGSHDFEKVLLLKRDGAVLLYNSDGTALASRHEMSMEDFMHCWGNGHLQLAGGPVSSTAPPSNQDPDVVAALGARVALAYEREAGKFYWYGGCVDSVDAQGGRWFCCDDGDVVHMPLPEVSESIKLKGLRLLPTDDGGMIASETGYPMAASIVWHREGRMPKAAPVGVLIGDTKQPVGETPVYQAFVVNQAVFGQDGELAPARPSRSAPAASARQHWRGFHTFRRGDKVEMVVNGNTYRATVFGVQYTGKESLSHQKYLLLIDDESSTYFVARFTDWSRVLLQPGGHVDQDSHVLTLSEAEVQVQVDDYAALQPFASLTTPAKLKFAAGAGLHGCEVNEHACSQPRPHTIGHHSLPSSCMLVALCSPPPLR